MKSLNFFLTYFLLLLSIPLLSQNKKEITAVGPGQENWLTPSNYKDGRERAYLYGDSNGDSAWVDRVKIPAGVKVPAHTHLHDELVTVLEGTWYLGEGKTFDTTKLKEYPTGTFIVIPAGTPHFVAAKDGPVIIQISGVGKFSTEYLEK